MLRLGKYTGKLYRDEEIENMQECGVYYRRTSIGRCFY